MSLNLDTILTKARGRVAHTPALHHKEDCTIPNARKLTMGQVIERAQQNAEHTPSFVPRESEQE